MGTGSFPGVKCGRGVLLTTHPLLVPRSWKSRAISLPSGPHRACNGNALPLLSLTQNIFIILMAAISGHNGYHQVTSQKLKEAGTYRAKSSVYMGSQLHLLTALKLLIALTYVICSMMCRRCSVMDDVRPEIISTNVTILYIFSIITT